MNVSVYSVILEKGVFLGLFLYRGLNTCYRCYKPFRSRGRGRKHHCSSKPAAADRIQGLEIGWPPLRAVSSQTWEFDRTGRPNAVHNPMNGICP